MQRPREWFLLLLLSILELWGGQPQVLNPNVTPAAPILPLRSRCPHDVSVSSVSARPNHDIFSINLVAISVNRNCCRRYYCVKNKTDGGHTPRGTITSVGTRSTDGHSKIFWRVVYIFSSTRKVCARIVRDWEQTFRCSMEHYQRRRFPNR